MDVPDSVNVESFIPVLKTRLVDNFLVELRNGLDVCTSMVLYRELCQRCELSPYLISLNNRKHGNLLAKLRLSSHQLIMARWLSGRVSDSGARGPGFETYLRRVVSLSKTLYSPKVLVNYPGSDGSVPT